MLKNCSKCNGKMIKVEISVGNLANQFNKISPYSKRWVCQNCDYEEKA